MATEPAPPTVEERTLAALEEIARWTRFMGLKGARETIRDVLRTEEDRVIYHLSTGASSREIEKAVGISRTTIQKRWLDWQSLGIMRDSVKWQGRKEAVFSLQELGLDVPERAVKASRGGIETEETPAPPAPDAARPRAKPIEQFPGASSEEKAAGAPTTGSPPSAG